MTNFVTDHPELQAFIAALDVAARQAAPDGAYREKAPCLAYEVLLPGHDGAIDDYAYLQYWNLTDHYLDQAAAANRDRLDYHRKAFRYAEQSALEMLPRVPAAAKTPPPVAA